FQADDGIRDATVTGVQTCALPISGTHFPLGTTTVTCIAADRHANNAAKSFPVVVVFSNRVAQSTAILSPSLDARLSRPPLLSWQIGRASCRERVSRWVCEDG